MNIVVDKSHDLMSHSAAERMAAVIRQKPDGSILVATGNTPIRAYELLATMLRESWTDVSRIRAVQLDEYLGVGENDPRSLYAWMDRAFIQPLAVSSERIVRFDATGSNPDDIVQSFDREVEAVGGIDLAILGLGPNGHLGFNEPPSGADAPTRVVELSAASLASNRVYWGEGSEVPTRALTAGMTTILNAREILLLVSGAHKAQILRDTIKGPVTPNNPASLLQTVTDRVTVFADDAAWGDRGSA